MKKHILILTMLALAVTMSAAVLSGTGSGESEDTAKSYALQDLTTKISVEVSSRIIDFVEEGGIGKTSESSEYSAGIIDVKSEMPVLGAIFSTICKPSQTGRIYTCTATLDTESSLPLYERSLAELQTKINRNIAAAQQKANNQSKNDILCSVLTDMKQYDKYKITAIYLGLTNHPKLDMTESEILDMLRQTQKQADSLDYAGYIIGDKIKKYKNIMVCPIMPDGLKEVTDLSKSLRTNIQSNCAYTSKSEQARYFLRGHYTALNGGQNGISVVCNLKDRNNNNLQTIAVDLSPESYKNIDYTPKTADFAKMISEGIMKPSEFRAELRTNKDNSDPLFSSDETVKIYLKLNQAGYYYIQGFVLKEEEMFSYLVELNEGMGNRKFIGYINQDDANKWIELGEFTVEPPYGNESLHITASTADFTELPATHYDQTSGYYIVGNSVSEAIKATRGIQRKKTAEVLNAEDTLIFTTMQ